MIASSLQDALPGTRQKPAKQRNPSLDGIRALAALAVLINHIRAFLFVPFGETLTTGVFSRVFYYLTGFGHQAVMIFFVLSGYLVGGSIMDRRSGPFWRPYAVQRMTRLWSVLIPSLAATALLNFLGYYSGGASYLNGLVGYTFNSGPIGMPVHLDFRTFIGNCMFLQTIAVPIYGDNGPLWSLANEFWYYCLFPIVWLGFQTETELAQRFVYLLLALIIIWLLPVAILMGFAVWLLGVLVYFLINRRDTLAPLMALLGQISFIVFLFVLHASRTGRVSDIAVGATFAGSLLWLVRIHDYPIWMRHLFSAFSDFSYTIYLTHFPFVAFIWYSFFEQRHMQLSIYSAVIFLIIMSVTIAYCFALARLFESNTDRVRAWTNVQISRIVDRPS